MARSRRRQRRNSRAIKAGLPAGVPVYVGVDRTHAIHVAVFDYNQEGLTEHALTTPTELARMAASPTVTWVNVDGIHEPATVESLCRAFNVHPLWIEDLLNATARPKVEIMEGQVLVLARAITATADGQVCSEHHGFVIGAGWILSFQERPGDMWGPVRERLRHGLGRARRMPASYLFHSLLDAIVDEYFAVLDGLELAIDELEDVALTGRARDVPSRMVTIKGDLAHVRAAVAPLREALPSLLTADEMVVSDEVRPFILDLRDHTDQASEGVDALRDRLVVAFEIHLAMTNQSLNETMRMLTVMSTVFMPLTFIVGVYGMNFDVMPELHWTWGYPSVWAVILVVSAGMIGWFKQRGWL